MAVISVRTKRRRERRQKSIKSVLQQTHTFGIRRSNHSIKCASAPVRMPNVSRTATCRTRLEIFAHIASSIRTLAADAIIVVKCFDTYLLATISPHSHCVCAHTRSLYSPPTAKLQMHSTAAARCTIQPLAAIMKALSSIEFSSVCGPRTSRTTYANETQYSSDTTMCIDGNFSECPSVCVCRTLPTHVRNFFSIHCLTIYLLVHVPRVALVRITIYNLHRVPRLPY